MWPWLGFPDDVVFDAINSFCCHASVDVPGAGERMTVLVSVMSICCSCGGLPSRRSPTSRMALISPVSAFCNNASAIRRKRSGSDCTTALRIVSAHNLLALLEFWFPRGAPIVNFPCAVTGEAHVKDVPYFGLPPVDSEPAQQPVQLPSGFVMQGKREVSSSHRALAVSS